MTAPRGRGGRRDQRGSLAGDVASATSDAWKGEPALVEERSRWHPDAPAWHAWNRMAPEREFCELVGALVRMVKPALVIETGVGQGFTTRRIAPVLPPGSVLKAFESDQEWREQLASLPFFDGESRVLADTPTPSDDDFATADLFVADSASELRRDEVTRWAERAKHGSYIVAHDTGHGHPEWTPHYKLGELIASLGISGVRLPNPRGSFVGQR
jgi:predicted O-methyltransferase YrrM